MSLMTRPMNFFSKAQEIDANPNVALVFYWNASNRSVRIEGKVERIPASESEDNSGNEFRPKVALALSSISGLFSAFVTR